MASEEEMESGSERKEGYGVFPLKLEKNTLILMEPVEVVGLYSELIRLRYKEDGLGPHLENIYQLLKEECQGLR